MSIEKHISADQATVTIRIDGMFDLSVQSKFRAAYEESGPSKKYVLDMRDTEYMDSAAFGMLLVFRDHIGGDNSEITIINASDDIVRSFKMLHFDRMFHLQ